MRKRGVIAVMVLIVAAYCGAIVIGLHVRNLGVLSELPTFPASGGFLRKADWAPPSIATIPSGPKGDSIRRGRMIFNETALYAKENTGARISCANCHAEGGIQPYASPMVSVPATFPQFNQRAGHVISLKDRIQECFVRSENGKPLDYEGKPMAELVDYINWLSTPQPARKKFVGRGLEAIPDLTPNVEHGRAIYFAQCSGCHGSDGAGHAPMFPALWGKDSFNDGAGMHGVKKMAAFVKHNMPQNRMGMLSAQEAWDVSAFVHEQPRPAFNVAYKHF